MCNLPWEKGQEKFFKPHFPREIAQMKLKCAISRGRKDKKNESIALQMGGNVPANKAGLVLLGLMPLLNTIYFNSIHVVSLLNKCHYIMDFIMSKKKNFIYFLFP
jgi:hypothetical protein